MSRSYSDSSYGSKKILVMNKTGSTVGTSAGTDLIQSTTNVEFPITIQDWTLHYVAGGTSSVKSLILNTKLAGTGSNVGIGTIVLGTDATGGIRAGSVTETQMAASDTLMVTFDGTDAIVADVRAHVTYVERFVVSDN